MILRKVRHYVFICSDPLYRRVQFSKLFDTRYYFARYPELKAKRNDLLRHYLDVGWKERRRPSLIFDNYYYCREYLDKADPDVNPLIDYIETGWREGKNPNQFFDTSFYVERYGANITRNINPLTHYIKIGWKRGYLPSPLFLERKHERMYYKLMDEGWNPVVHYLEEEEKQRFSPPDYFDADWYHDNHPLLPNSRAELWRHYMVHGVVDQKSPVPVFDASYYRQRNRDVEKSFVEPFRHYREKEKLDCRRPAPFFDPEYYRAAICRRQDQQKSLLEHYLRVGVFERVYTDQRVADLAHKPLISIILPVYNPTRHQLNLCIRSVLYQAYPHWELCICDDRSTAEHVQERLMYWANRDNRIKVVCHLQNGGISRATNTAASLSSGEYLGFLDNDDELRRDCLYHIAKTISDTGGDMLYTDEDLVNESGSRLSVFYKPGYNRELLLGHNYITHFMVVKRELFEKCGGCDPATDGAQDFDLALKVTEKAERVVHIPEILYHWRVSESSTNFNHDAKLYADDAGKLAVEKAFARNGLEGEVLKDDWRFYYQPRRKLLAEPLVTVIVHAVDGVEYSEKDLSKINQVITGYSNAELLLTAGTSDSTSRERYLQSEAEVERCTFLPCHDSPGKAELLNRAVARAAGEFVLFLSSDVMPEGSNWIQQLLEYGQDHEVGLVCGRLVSGEAMLGISRVPDIWSASALYYRWFLLNCSIHMNCLQFSQEVTAAPLELCLVRKELFAQVGGFSSATFPSLYMDLDFSYRIRSMGLFNIYTPYCRADWDYQHLLELNKSRDSRWQKEKKSFQRIWRKELIHGDPYYHPGCYREEGISDEEFLQWYAGVSAGEL